MPILPKFADLHCHTTLAMMHEYSQGESKRFNSQAAHPWSVPKAKRKAIKKGLRAQRYTQSDFAHLSKGNVRLVFATLYPFEQGYFIRKDNDPRATIIVSLVSGIPLKRVKWFLENEAYNYWDELKKEYTLIRRRSGIRSSDKILFKHPSKNRVIKERVEGQYWLIADNPTDALTKMSTEDVKYKGDKGYAFKSFEDLDEIVSKEGQTAVLLCIEGAHWLTLNKDGRFEEPVSEMEMWKRVEEIKLFDPPIFYLTPSHHFNNTLISHARSIPDMLLGCREDMNELEEASEEENMTPDEIALWEQRNTIGLDLEPNQLVNMNYINENNDATKKGMKPLGEKLLLELLHLEKSGTMIQNKSSSGRRILIDVKHMSALARKEFYNNIIIPYNTKHNPKIPIIASHVAYSGIKTLDDMIRDYEKEDNSSTGMNDGVTTFTKWNINLSDEDIQMICDSGGMIGIVMEQRVLGVPYSIAKDDFGIGRVSYEKGVKWERLVSDNIYRFIKAVSPEQQLFQSENSIWKCICIGSDFDGGIDPPNPYPTSVEFEKLRKDLIEEMKKWTDLSDFGLTSENIDLAVDAVCFDNLFNFVKRVHPQL